MVPADMSACRLIAAQYWIASRRYTDSVRLNHAMVPVILERQDALILDCINNFLSHEPSSLIKFEGLA